MTEMPTFELEHPYADLLGFVVESKGDGESRCTLLANFVDGL